MSRRVEFVVRSSEDFGRAIAELRHLRGETQEQTASSMGLSRSYLAQVERGRLPRTVGLVLGLLRRAGATVTITAEVGAAEVGAAEVGAAEVGAAEVGAAEVGDDEA